MERILFVLGKWGNGGIEKVIVTYCNQLIPKGYHINIFAFEKEDSVFTKELEKIGIKIFAPNKKIEGGYLRRNMEKIKEFIKAADGDYDIIHYHSSFAIAYIHLNVLKKTTQRYKCILHCHGSDVERPHLTIKRIFNKILKKKLRNVPDFCMACSEKAGKWLFSKDIYESNKYKTIPNAFDTEAYSFNFSERKRIQEDLNISSKCILGTIGRFCYQKNPEFILNILKKLDQSGMDFTFIWIGEGDLKNVIMQKAEKYHVLKRMRFISFTNDVPSYLSAMDAFLLPSRYEGLALVLIEALSSGLPCYVSDTIPRETKVTEKIQYLPIRSEDIWIEKILFDYNEGRIVFDDHEVLMKNREYPKNEMQNSKFDLKHMICDLIKVYDQVMEKGG